MSVKINPVKAVLEECKNSNSPCGIHKMNDMCYGICNDYKNTPECLQTCREFIVNKRICQKGPKCPNKVVPRASPIFNSVNDNFTPYVKELGVEGSLKKCNTICENRSSKPYECKQKCRLNANAIVEDYKPQEKHKDSKSDIVHDIKQEQQKNKKSIILPILLTIAVVIGIAGISYYYFVVKAKKITSVAMGTGMFSNIKDKGIKTATNTFCNALRSPLGRQELLRIINPEKSSLKPNDADLLNITNRFCDKL